MVAEIRGDHESEWAAMDAVASMHVHGASVGGRIEGACISIVRRSGEDSVHITAKQIHATLAVGRTSASRLTSNPQEWSGVDVGDIIAIRVSAGRAGIRDGR